MLTQGSAFLEASIGPVIRRLCTERVTIEIDPARSHKKNVDKHTDLLVYWCQEFWKSIYDARKYCPELVFLTLHGKSLLTKLQRHAQVILPYTTAH